MQVISGGIDRALPKHPFVDVASFQQQPPMFDSLWSIDSKQFDCGSPNRGLSQEHRAIPFEMIAPVVLAWIEQRHKCVGHWVKCRRVAALERIAQRAGKTGVLERRRSPMFAGADMINFVGKDRVLLRQATIFASAPSMLPNQLTTRRHGRLVPPRFSKRKLCLGVHQVKELADAKVLFQRDPFCRGNRSKVILFE